MKTTRPSRRCFLAGSAAAALGLATPERAAKSAAPNQKKEDKAQIAITLDLEMSRNFPTWEQTHWDYEKGNLDGATKKYTAEACRRVKARGGLVHCFVVGRVFEQESVDWLKRIAAAGHPIGNHTYDHVNVKATERDQLQFRFKRAPWLIRGKTIPQLVRENIEITDIALKSRVGVASDGCRTPAVFTPDVRIGRMCSDCFSISVSSGSAASIRLIRSGTPARNRHPRSSPLSRRPRRRLNRSSIPRD